jgi:hypothetical protein
MTGQSKLCLSYADCYERLMCRKAASKTRPHPPTCEFPSSNIQARGGGDVAENDVRGCVWILAALNCRNVLAPR